MTRTRAFIGLGANLGQPRAAIDRAIALIGEIEDTCVLRRARVYRSAPVGPQDQPEYVNTAVEIETALEPAKLLVELKTIERKMGRTETLKWGPRIIDLDILLYGAETVSTPGLEIPHPELACRRFVLQPLSDLSPDLVIPGGHAPIRSLLDALRDDPTSVRLDVSESLGLDTRSNDRGSCGG